MPPVTFIGSVCKIHVVLCSKIADIHGIEVHDVCNLFIFGHFSDFYCITPEVSRGGDNSLGAESLRGGKKSQQCQKDFSSKQYICFRKTSGSNMGAPNLFLSKGHLTSLRPWTSRLSSQNGEICLKKYLHISGKLSITNYLTQNVVDYRSHFTIENNLKVEEEVHYFENKHNFPSHGSVIMCLLSCNSSDKQRTDATLEN